MANPNIVAVTSILGNTTFITPANTTANVLLSNAASSGDVLKINQIVAANVNGTSAVDTTVAVNNAAAGAGTSFPVVSTVSVPADASIIVAARQAASAILLATKRSLALKG